eukprot:SAG31_NODE_12162_length_963_cov_0.966435_2_plen_214_part_00
MSERILNLSAPRTAHITAPHMLVRSDFVRDWCIDGKLTLFALACDAGVSQLILGDRPEPRSLLEEVHQPLFVLCKVLDGVDRQWIRLRVFPAVRSWRFAGQPVESRVRASENFLVPNVVSVRSRHVLLGEVAGCQRRTARGKATPREPLRHPHRTVFMRTSLISGSPDGRFGFSLASFAATASNDGVNSLQWGLRTAGSARSQQGHRCANAAA